MELYNIKKEEQYQDDTVKEYKEFYENEWVRKKYDKPIIIDLISKGYFNDLILDVGSGTGANAELISIICGEGWIDCLDISQEMLNYCKKRKVELRTIHADIQKTDIPSDKYNTILCYGTIHHIPDVYKALFEMNRIIKKNGSLIILENNPHSFHAKLIPQWLRSKMQPEYMQPKNYGTYGISEYEVVGHRELNLLDIEVALNQMGYTKEIDETYYFARIVKLSKYSFLGELIFKAMKPLDWLVHKYRCGFYRLMVFRLGDIKGEYATN